MNNNFEQNNMNMQNGLNQNNNMNMQNELNPNNNMNIQNELNPNNNMNIQNGLNPNNNMNMQNGLNPNNNMNMQNGLNPNNNMNMQNGLNQNTYNNGMSPNFNGGFVNNVPKKNKMMPFIVGGAVLFVVLVSIGILLLTSGKKLTCSRSENSSYMNYSEKLKFKFKNDEVNSLKADYVIEIVDEDYDAKELADEMEETCEDLLEEVDSKGVTCKASYNKNTVSFSITAKRNAVGEALGLYENEFTYDQVKEQFVDEGYRCE